MGKNRLEAFSDGVLAIIITIMVLELKVPHGDDFPTLLPLIPTFFSYILSFIYIAIYWNNHHHMLHTCHRVNAQILWSNMNLLFWLSLVPFATAWMGENHFSNASTAVYGFVLLLSAFAYLILQQAIIKSQGPESILRKAVQKDWKGKTSQLLYISGIVSSFCSVNLAIFAYIAVAFIWLIPDRRIENVVAHEEK